jgi:hypothetical protein
MTDWRSKSAATWRGARLRPVVSNSRRLCRASRFGPLPDPGAPSREKSWHGQACISKRLPGTSRRVNCPSGVQSFRPNENATGGGGIRRRSREPPANTVAADMFNVPIKRGQLRTIESGLPDVASRSFRRRGEVWLPSSRWVSSRVNLPFVISSTPHSFNVLSIHSAVWENTLWTCTLIDSPSRLVPSGKVTRTRTLTSPI